MKLLRREFLRRAGLLTGYFVVEASTIGFAARLAVAAEATPGANNNERFPQGVASGDPQPGKVLLWTRVEPPAYGSDVTERLTLQVTQSQNFNNVVLEQEFEVTQDSDFALRVVVTRLEPDTTYYYRFIDAFGVPSRIGRTWTAPPADAERPVNIMFASCSGFPANKYGALRHFLTEQAMANQPRADLVLHLGDYVYGIDEEQIGQKGPEPLIVVGDKSVSPPAVGGPAALAATTEAEYSEYQLALAAHRRIYRAYHKDPDFQDIRALYPFVIIWDDHEYENDVWQSYIAGQGANPERRLAATRAWFEHVPQILDEAASVPGVENEAYDFRPTTVGPAKLGDFDEAFLSLEPNNLAAITAMACYRVVRWGSMVDLIVADERSYRGPGAHPAYSLESIESEEADARAFSGLQLFEGKLLNTLALGRTANGGNPPATVMHNGKEIPNPRVDAPPVSMLGIMQKDWLKRVLTASTARWKAIANSVPIMGFSFNPGVIKPEVGNGYWWTDSWDGFPNERAELMRFLRENNITNVVSLSGDRHAHYAGLVAEDYTAENPDYVMPDFTCTSISAFARMTNAARNFRAVDLGHLISYRRPNADGEFEIVSNMNVLMRYGAKAAAVMADTNDLDAALAAADPETNPHMVYADNDSPTFMALANQWMAGYG